MSTQENTLLQQLLEQQAAIAKQIAELRAAELKKQQEEEDARRKSQQKVAIFNNFQYGYITVECDNVMEINSVLRECRTRKYYNNAGGSIVTTKNVIHVSELDKLLAQFQTIPNLEIKYTEGIEEAARKWLDTPPYHVAIKSNKKEFVITLGPTADRYRITDLPGAKQERNTDATISLPLTEGWRLISTLETEPKTVYTDEAKEFILKQVELRNSLDKIALMKDTEYEVSFTDNRKLRAFQKVGATFIEAAGGSALLADDTGLGKTLQALAVAIKNDYRTIVVCPANLKKNWTKEILALTNEVPYVLLGGSPSKADMEHILLERPKIIIINYDILGKSTKIDKVKKDGEGFLHGVKEVRWLWVELLNLYKPDLVIWDEGHYLQNHDSNRSQASRLLKSPRNIIATATPLVNRPPNLWPILTIINPELFPSHDHFVARYTTDGKHARNVEELREIMKTMMIRRKKQDVIADLPPIIPINDYQTLSPKARKLYDKVLTGVYQIVKEWNPNEAGHEKKVTNILVQIMRCKQICAIDKVEATADKAVELFDSAEGNDNRKVIIFSQFVPVVKGIARRLGQEAIIMTGEQSLDERNRLVWQFQNNPDVHFAVCSSKAISEGLTMTRGGNIIFHDLLWHKAGHEQCIGRAYGRLNDAHGIGVFYEICEDTIEEWIMELIADKEETNNEIVEGTVASRDVSVAMALIQKIKNSM